jgi:hypothetical protein
MGLLLAGGAAVGYRLTRPPDHDYGTVPAPGRLPAAAAAAGSGSESGPSRPAGTASPSPGGGLAVRFTRTPVRLSIPALGVSAPITATGVQAGGQLAIPADPADVGWWAGGASPGDATGAVILAGHIDSAASGPGALFRLADLRPGETVTVDADGGDYRYRVVALRGYAKTALPAAAIFSQQVTARLVIISCGGPFDSATGHYLDNIVAYAVPAV